MILYHGSYLAVEKPNISFSRDDVDFGKGFYTTPIKEQAIRWAERFKLRQGRQAIISIYEVDEERIYKEFSVMKFDTYSDEWLDFVVASRKGETVGDYDIVIGGVANDKVFDTIELFLNELIDKKEAIKRLRYEKPNIQYCFRNQGTIDKLLTFVSSEVLT